MTMAGSSILVDTNVLLTAITPSRPLHRRAFEVLEQWPNRGVSLLTTGQILREFLVVSTRPLEANGLGLSPDAALRNAGQLWGRMVFLSETKETAEELVRLVSEKGCRGKQIHDVNLVATLCSHGARRILTSNAGDFRRFADLVEVVDLATAGLV